MSGFATTVSPTGVWVSTYQITTTEDAVSIRSARLLIAFPCRQLAKPFQPAHPSMHVSRKSIESSSEGLLWRLVAHSLCAVSHSSGRHALFIRPQDRRPHATAPPSRWAVTFSGDGPSPVSCAVRPWLDSTSAVVGRGCVAARGRAVVAVRADRAAAARRALPHTVFSPLSPRAAGHEAQARTAPAGGTQRRAPPTLEPPSPQSAVARVCLSASLSVCVCASARVRRCAKVAPAAWAEMVAQHGPKPTSGACGPGWIAMPTATSWSTQRCQAEVPRLGGPLEPGGRRAVGDLPVPQQRKRSRRFCQSWHGRPSALTLRNRRVVRDPLLGHRYCSGRCALFLDIPHARQP